jgi:outer membrane protein assembly factor BamA
MPLKKISVAIAFLSIFFTPLVFNYALSNPDSLAIAPTETIKIDSVRIKGNDATADFIILRELNFKPGDNITGQQLKYNKERIVSLGLFSRVELYVIKNDNKNVAVIEVYESWYIYPIPIVRFKDRDKSKVNYGVSLLYKNFRGRNETLRTMVSFGYDPYYAIQYSIPALFYEQGIGLYINTSYSTISNRSDIAKYLGGGDFNYKVFSNSISVEKRINQFNDITVTLGHTYLESDVFGIGRLTASSRKIDRVPYIGLSYFYDTRDLKQYSLYGLYTGVSLIQKGFGLEDINYSIFDLDFREYRRIFDDLSGRWRLTLRSTFGGSVPYYDYSFLGYGNFVRGHSTDYKEGNNSILTSFELIYPLIKEWNVSFKLPLLPEKLTSARLGLYLTSFIDYGGIYNNPDKFSLAGFYSGYGFGLTILVIPYNAVRFEYAIGDNGIGEFLFGVGFSF